MIGKKEDSKGWERCHLRPSTEFSVLESECLMLVVSIVSLVNLVFI